MRVRLQKSIERTLRAGHPWVYRDALAPFTAAPGDVITIDDARGERVAEGIADSGPIAVRVMSTDDARVGEELFAARVREAAALRDRVVPANTNAYRLVHGEGDRVPGLVCDVYGDHAVMKLDGEGLRPWRDTLVKALAPVLSARGVTTLLERSGRQEERETRALIGALPSENLRVTEHGMVLEVDLVHGQKTGLFLDHRESRHRVRSLSRGATVLNLYAYTGGFSVSAGLGGALRVDTVDVAKGAIDLAERTWALNGLDPALHRTFAKDVPEFLKQAQAKTTRYGLVISDPPSFAPSEASLKNALTTYRTLHASAISLVEPGGLLLAASCSSHVHGPAFDETIREGAHRAGRVLQLLDGWGAPPDHPRILAFPEGDYLKSRLLRVL